jgi:hypothetical protein
MIIATSIESHRRGSSRLRLGIPARLETFDGPQHVRLLDLSQSGAQVLISPQLPFKSAVLGWLAFEAFGDVVWQTADHAGLQFDEPVPMDWIIETRQQAPAIVRNEKWSAHAAAREWVAGNLRVGAER